MSILSPDRLRLVLPAATCFGLVLLWGCALIYVAGIGTHICEHYTYTVGGANPRLRDWCRGVSWRGWLSSCLLAAAAALALGTLAALWTARAVWLASGTALAGICVWVGFALPQVLAGPEVVVDRPMPTPTPLAGAPPTSGPLSRALPARLALPRMRGLAHDILPGAPFRCPRGSQIVEHITGPGRATPFDRVTLSRGPDGLCAIFQGGPVASYAVAQSPSMVVSLFLRRRPIGDPSRLVAGGTPGLVNVELWTRDFGRVFSLIVRRSHATATPATVGDVGVANGYAAIYVKYPRLPAWVLGRPLHWTAVPG